MSSPLLQSHSPGPPPPARPRRGLSITLRAALWSWVVALVTLLSFAAALLPQQQRTLQENLESKARAIAVSLRDVAAGAVVNEDFSAVVDHCKEMLRGDPALEYLVITKNDGFSLINERTGWHVEPKAGPEWRPATRTAKSGIGVVPLFQRRVFYYSQPFDYSGIEWGWIHVGLSLHSYDRSVDALSLRAGLLAIGCAALSLAASGFYAARLVKPILHLRNVVQRVTGGDLTARAELQRSDELGTLAGSVNVMTEALWRRDQIMESVRFAAQQFLSSPDWNTAAEAVLGKIGQAANVSRACLFENRLDAQGRLFCFQRHEWAAPGIHSHRGDPTPQGGSFEEDGLGRWVEVLGHGGIISGPVAQLPAAERQLLEARGVRSLTVIPIHVEGSWWGCLGFDDCVQERVWTENEHHSLRAAADILGAAIARQRTQDALLEAKATLEERVKARTAELVEEGRAKDRAHAALAEAQQKLIEASREAGMAEVATGVLHNVGNVLNSVNVSVQLVNERLRRSQSLTLSKVAEVLQEHAADLPAYLTADSKGRLLPVLIHRLAAALQEERERLLQETQGMLRNVEHIKEIVAMQQGYARLAGVTEDLPVIDLIEDAVRLNDASFRRNAIVLRREFQPVPLVRVDKHKVLQILVNLFRNAKDAMTASGRPDRVLTLNVSRAVQGPVRVSVADNGIGIEPANLTRIFAHGFTTKKDGHGFGLHSGALAAKAMGGSLTAFSSGLGCGAVFVLELPAAETSAAHPNKVSHEPTA